MRPSPLLLRNVQEVAALLRRCIGPGRPPRCYYCERDLAPVRLRYAVGELGFLECPGCRAEYVYIRRMTIEVRREYVPLDFHRTPIEVIVWQQDGPPFSPPATWDRHPPPGYAAGILRGYIDGRAVSFDELSAALWPSGSR